jgi:hypothetical protein
MAFDGFIVIGGDNCRKGAAGQAALCFVLMSQPRRLEYMPLSEVQRALRNPKAHDLELITTSVNRFGYVEPIILDERSGLLVAGHGRLDTLETLQKEGRPPPDGITQVRLPNGEVDWAVPVTRGWSSKSDREAEAYLLAANETSKAGGWNNEKLAEVLKSINDSGEDALKGTGFDEDYLERLLLELQPSFSAASLDDQGELDQKKRVSCPECGHEFVP